MPMRGKTVLVTGATGGIGKQTALALAQLGARVIVTGRSRSSGKAAVGELSELSGNDRVGLLLADLSTRAGVQSLAVQFKQEHGALDVLINTTMPALRLPSGASPKTVSRPTSRSTSSRRFS